MTTAKLTSNTGAQYFRYPAARFTERGCLQVWVGDALITQLYIAKLKLCYRK
jgi:hypothetical protein